MRFARYAFIAAGIWGLLLLTPLYFMFDLIGRNDPPPITHPGFFYGFVGVSLAWQFAFFVIASDPLRFRPMMVPAILEKLGYGVAAIVLYTQQRLHGQDLAFGAVDLILGTAFAVAYLRLRPGRRGLH
jgi:hypothetical protein